MFEVTNGAFTGAHVLISLVGISSGLYVLYEMLRGRLPAAWTAIFLATTVATSATGFLFHSRAFGPARVVGLLSLVLLALALVALYGRRLVGAWRATYVISAVAALYLNVFVAVVQAFLKIPTLRMLAPTQTEPAFVIAQGVTLVVFIALGALATRRMCAEPATAS